MGEFVHINISKLEVRTSPKTGFFPFFTLMDSEARIVNQGGN
jgi:hypothetical protein